MRLASPPGAIAALALALAAAIAVGAGIRAGELDGRTPSHDLPIAPETIAISEVELAPAVGDAASRTLRLVHCGNPPRWPALPDLSRAGVHEFPGRLSLEVPELGVGWGDRWLPPGIYRLALATDGMTIALSARPLAPGSSLDFPLEAGTLTAPLARFRAHLGARHVDGARTAILTIRWGVLILEATIDAPEPESVRVAEWTLRAVARPGPLGDETYLGELGEPGGEASEIRWIRAAEGARLRVERSRRRHLFALRREYAARAERLHALSESALASGDEAEAERIGRLAESYDERAAQLDRPLAALEGSSRDIPGAARPGAGDRVAVTLVERGDDVLLVIDAPAGGAEFLLR